MKGIDVSMHNGNINFRIVRNSGVNVVIIKATEGVQYVDPYLERHYNGAKSAGLNIGFYHFMSEKTNPTQQAIDFWDSIKNKKFNVLPCLDIETNNIGRNRTQISNRCVEFLNKFKALSGYDCMIYTGGYFGRNNLDSRVKKYLGWIAHYGVNTPMATGFNVVGHQYASNGKINGINGNVDVNNFTNKIFIEKVAKVSKTKEMKIQNMLVTIGYPVGNSGIDGILGNGSITAIKCFQRDCNLVADGIVGSKTWDRLVLEHNKKLEIKTETKSVSKNKEEYDMDKLILYFGDLDALSALIISQKNGCSMMRESDYNSNKIKAKEIIRIGGPNGNATGKDRFETFKAAGKLV